MHIKLTKNITSIQLEYKGIKRHIFEIKDLTIFRFYSSEKNDLIHVVIP